MNNLNTEEAYMVKMEDLRKKMVHAAKKYGMAHPLVLRYSRELDRMHNYLLFSNSPTET